MVYCLNNFQVYNMVMLIIVTMLCIRFPDLIYLTSRSLFASLNFCSGFLRRRQWHPTPVLLPGKSHGWRSLEGCSPWGRWRSDMIERLHFHFSLSCIGEGNGNPLQCSFLENPRDGGACWAAVNGVAQSRTRLMWLSSSKVASWCPISPCSTAYPGPYHPFSVSCTIFIPLPARALCNTSRVFSPVISSLWSHSAECLVSSSAFIDNLTSMTEWAFFSPFLSFKYQAYILN